MSRSTVVCTEKHTPLSPHKNRVRRDWMKSVLKSKDIITISHALLDVAMLLEWKGRIQVCDIDPGVREATHYLAGLDGKPSDYPDLNILSPGGQILHTVEDYCRHYGVNRLGAVDVDLACGIKPAWDILRPVLFELRSNGYRGKVLLTFCLRRDGFKSMEDRIAWLKFRLRGTEVVRYEQYQSVRISEHASRSKGSAMCIVELQVKSRPSHKVGRPSKAAQAA